MRKVFIEGSDSLLNSMFLEEGYEITSSLFGADLLCLEGGADVSPILYGEEVNGAMGCSEDLDLRSMGLILAARTLDIPIVGICRGGQILNVVNGGSMVQHIGGHAGKMHTVNAFDADWLVSSSHHQEMVPPEDDVTVYCADDGCVEIVVFNGESEFSFQPHPEYVNEGHPCRELFFKLLDDCFE